MVMVLDLYGAFSMWTYSNALYNTLWGTFARLLYGAVNNLFLMLQVEFTGAPRTEWLMPDHNAGNFMPIKKQQKLK